MAAHTPGPWKCEEILPNYGHVIFRVRDSDDDYDDGDVIMQGSLYGDNADDNGRLMARAPQLLEENKRLRDALTQIMRRGDSMTNTPLGTQRQERYIWQGMTHIAATALQAEAGGE